MTIFDRADLVQPEEREPRTAGGRRLVGSVVRSSRRPAIRVPVRRLLHVARRHDPRRMEAPMNKLVDLAALIFLRVFPQTRRLLVDLGHPSTTGAPRPHALADAPTAAPPPNPPRK